jgi:hypothetical protein
LIQGQQSAISSSKEVRQTNGWQTFDNKTSNDAQFIPLPRNAELPVLLHIGDLVGQPVRSIVLTSGVVLHFDSSAVLL